MKIAKIFSAAVAAFVLGSGAAFAELPEGVSLTNEFKWGVMEFSRWDGEWDTSLSAPTNTTKAMFESDKLRFGVKFKVGVDQETLYNNKEIQGYVAHGALEMGYAQGYEMGYKQALAAGAPEEMAAMYGIAGAKTGMATALNTLNPSFSIAEYEAMIPDGADANAIYDAMLKPAFGAYNADALDGEGYLYAQYKSMDLWLEFKPVDQVTVGFSADMDTAGSYLPIYDDNISTGFMGSDGLTLAVDPLGFLDGDMGKLNIAVTVPLDNNRSWLKGDKDGTMFYMEKNSIMSGSFASILENSTTYIGEQTFNFGIGAEYSYDGIGALGFTMSDVADDNEKKLGVYGMLDLAEIAGVNLKVRGGFAHAFGDGDYIMVNDLDLYEASGIMGENIINASIEFSLDKFAAAVEMVSNMGEDYDDTFLVTFQDGGYYGANLQKLTSFYFNREYDHYVGCRFGYDLNDSLNINFTGKFLFDQTSTVSDIDHAFLLGFNPGVTYKTGNHTFGASVAICYGSDEWVGLKFPVSWKYTF
ncbi:MAG: hypothetical protein KBS64_01650 [Treponema sp.]|nr:hypothetical protein [Candidatus Treponema equi]